MAKGNQCVRSNKAVRAIAGSPPLSPVTGLFLSKVVFIAFLLGTAPAGAAEERGTFGFSIEIDGDGFFLNPTLKSVTIVSVAAASPAANAGISPHDAIIEADGHIVVGAKAKDLEPLLKRNVGQSVRLKLRHPNGAEYLVTLVAVPRPDKP